eukprot:scaffold549_cov385-Prasinococcus_capsulatus_cf.AAC.40
MALTVSCNAALAPGAHAMASESELTAKGIAFAEATADVRLLRTQPTSGRRACCGVPLSDEGDPVHARFSAMWMGKCLRLLSRMWSMWHSPRSLRRPSRQLTACCSPWRAPTPARSSRPLMYVDARLAAPMPLAA